MVSTRSSSKQAPVDNTNLRRVIKQQIKKKIAQKPKVGGRKPTHDLRALIGIAIKIANPTASLEMAVEIVNEVCDNIKNSMHPAAEEKKLVTKTLRNRCLGLMKLVWKKIQSDQEEYSRAHWTKLVESRGTEMAKSIGDLTRQACERIMPAENRSKTPMPKDYVFDWDAIYTNYMIANNWVPVNNWVQLEPQPQEQMWYGDAPAPVQLGGGGNQVCQIEDIPGFNMDAEMHTDTFDISDINAFDENPGALEFELLAEDIFHGRD